MAERITDDIAKRLEETLSAGVSEDAIKRLKKQVNDICYEVESDIEYRLKDAIAPNLVSFVEEMAKRSIDAILAGNEDEMRRYLGCEQNRWNGRSDGDSGWGRKREAYEWHSVIHGKLFEQGAVAIRKQLVDAHRDLITSERILDLEDQVKSLVAQVNKANREKDEMWERLRDSQRV